MSVRSGSFRVLFLVSFFLNLDVGGREKFLRRPWASGQTDKHKNLSTLSCHLEFCLGSSLPMTMHTSVIMAGASCHYLFMRENLSAACSHGVQSLCPSLADTQHTKIAITQLLDTLSPSKGTGEHDVLHQL